jgi:ATP-dependent Clp protease ATP-binding subunit ClpA
MVTMYDRFTDSARTVVSVAEAEAFARGADQVEPEDVLVALAQHHGVAGSVLRAVAADPALVRDGVQARTPASRGKEGRPRPLPLSQVTMTAFGLALREAEGFRVPFVATEHLLLGLLREPTGRTSDLLMSVRRDPGLIRERLFDLVASPGFVSPEVPESAPQQATSSPAGTGAPALEVPDVPAVASGGFLDADRALLAELVAEVGRLRGEVAQLRDEFLRPGAPVRMRDDREGRLLA